MDIIISIPVIINIKNLKPNLSIKYPHKNLEDPLTIPKNTPREYNGSWGNDFLFPKSLQQLDIKKSKTIIKLFFYYLQNPQKQSLTNI